jgi:hypothetical protein
MIMLWQIACLLRRFIFSEQLIINNMLTLDINPSVFLGSIRSFKLKKIGYIYEK